MHFNSEVLVGLGAVMVIGFLVVFWLVTLVDILKNDFTNPINKVVWILLVIFLPVIGVLLYYVVGKGQLVAKA